MRYTEQAKKIFSNMRRIARHVNARYVGTEHLLYALRHECTCIAAQILNDANITEEKLKSMITEIDTSQFSKDDYSEKILNSPMLDSVIKYASETVNQTLVDEIGSEHLLAAILNHEGCVAMKILYILKAPISEMLATLDEIIVTTNTSKFDKSLKFDENLNLGEYLSTYGNDITIKAYNGKLDPMIGRTEEMERIMRVLNRRTKNNPCLIGDPGVGKSAIVEGLASAIVSERVDDNLIGKHIISLDLSSMVAGSKYRGEFEERIKNVIEETLNNPNVLLFIDEVHTLIGAGGSEGSLDAANILKPYLARGEIQILSATTVAEYRKYIEKDAALERRFQPILIEEPSIQMSIDILKGLKKHYEDYHNVIIEDESIEEAVKLSKRYINDRFLPDKAIDVLDEACAKVKCPNSFNGMNETLNKKEEIKEIISDLEDIRDNYIILQDMKKASKQQEMIDEYELELEKLNNKKKKKSKNKFVVTPLIIDETITLMTHIPVSKLVEKESSKLIKLEETLHKRIVGQDNAVTKVSQAIRRSRVGLKDPKRPVGSFLFLGPTGVGKTEICKVLADTLFGSEDNIIKMDMSEYMESHSVSKMIGSPPGYVGYEDSSMLVDKVRKNPYSIVLFDEIEKAHPDIFNTLLQILDEGKITDSKGRTVDFKNTVIIMTSNIGARSIVSNKSLGFSSDKSELPDFKDMERSVLEEVKRTFKPEFLNRIDEVIVFNMLNEKELEGISKLLLDEVVKLLVSKGYEMTYSPSILKWIASKNETKEYGARPLRRIIQTEIENKITDVILKQKNKKKKIIEITLKDDDIDVLMK